MAGILIGSIAFGPFAESFGRKRATQIPAVIMFIFTVTTALCPNIYLYSVSQFLLGFGAGGYRVNCIILSTEWIGASKRSWGVCVTQLFSAVGQCVLAGVIYAIRHWRLAQLITAAPLGVVVVYIWFIPESARWLFSRGRTEEAKQLIVKAAAVNKRTVPDSLFDKIAVNNTVNRGGIKLIFRSPLLTRYFFTVVLAWFSLNLSFYCLYLNMGNFGLSIFVTQLLFGAIEIPANLLSMWLLEVFGRRVLFIATLLSGGLCCILIVAVPQGKP
uniref:Solute carrier family 22 member 13a n=1 Tax=Lates calcarifer TaxID=8187 RepID=A0A4W6CGI0_LATCA